MLIIERVKVLDGNILLAKGSDGRETLKGCRDMGVHRTAS